MFERREPYNDILEAAMGYAGVCGVVVMDEVVIVNERVDVTMLQVDLVKDEVETLKEQLANERELRRQLARSLADARTIADGLVGEVGRLMSGPLYPNTLSVLWSRLQTLVSLVTSGRC